MRLLGLTLAAVATCASGLLLSVDAAYANDTTAELTTGGLVLDAQRRHRDALGRPCDLRTRDRRALSLLQSMAADDETVTVAFPMPDIAWEGRDTNIAVPDPESPNFLDFHTHRRRRGQSRRSIEQKAFADDSRRSPRG